MWAVVSLQLMKVISHCHKWLTNDDHCAQQEALHHISMRLSSRLELRSASSNSELELLVGLGT